MPTRIELLSDLLLETGRAHHKAFQKTDGYDPEWAIWYADYLQNPISDILNRSLTQSEIIYELIRLDKTTDSSHSPWQEVYAMELMERYG